MHHICSILDLGTIGGSTATLPNYADVVIESHNIPPWALKACRSLRQPSNLSDIKKRWDELQNKIIPTWNFYAMPHSLLASMGTKRPNRPYWPNPGEEQHVIKRAIMILNQGRNGTLPRIWARQADVDGYDFSPREAAREAKRKEKESTKKHKGPSRAATANKPKGK